MINLLMSSVCLFAAINCEGTLAQSMNYAICLFNFGVFLMSLKSKRS
jgi:hypothetical protein